MRTIPMALLGALLACCSSSSPTNNVDTEDSDGPAADPLDKFFGLHMHEIKVTLPEESIDSLVAEPKVYTHAQVSIDGTVHQDVGFRLKGNAGSFIPWGGGLP